MKPRPPDRGRAEDGEREPPGRKPRPSRSPSMHEGIAVWCDCCSCEMEPYWAEVAEEMGIEVYNDYEDKNTDKGE